MGVIVISKISLVSLDIGGTLLSDDNTISKANVDAIRKLKSHGVKVVLSTAREYSSTRYISNQINCDYGVFSNGSHLMDINKLRTLKSSILKKEAVLELYRYCKKRNLYIHLSQEFCEVSDQMEYFNLKHNILNLSYPDELKSACYLIEDLEKYIKHNKITKVVIVSEENLDSIICELGQILKKYNLFITEHNRNLNEHIINKNINYIEIGATIDTKASGLIELAHKLNIPIDEVLVVGDGDNDLEMLSTFPNSICMCNGTKKAKRLAKYITKNDNNSSGVAEGLNYYMNRGV